MLGESAEPSLAEIHQEMSELLDEKVCDENERNKEKNDARVKIIFMEGSPL